MPQIQTADSKIEILEKSFVFDFKTSATEEGVIEGYGAYFGNQDRVGDIIEKGAFQKSIRRNNGGDMAVKMLWQHDYKQPVGIWTDLKEDSKGLYVKGKIITSAPQGLNAYELVKGGAIDGLSIGFTATKWASNDKTGIRSLQEIELYEISLVTFPANTKAKIDSVKSLPGTIREFENFLCDAGYSRSESKRIASHGFDKQRDVVILDGFKSLDSALEGLRTTLTI